MAGTFTKTWQLSSGLLVLAGQLYAADPGVPDSANSLSSTVRAPISISSTDFIPPAPLEIAHNPAPAQSVTSPVYAPTPGHYQPYHSGAYPHTTLYYGTPGGYEARIGSPYYYHVPGGGQFVVTGDPYYDHFGPGFHRHSLHGHYRFPYYNYRAPWYYPGRAVYNRDTNFAW